MAELDRAAISERIAQARTEAGLTQEELGDALTPPAHKRTIQTWESLKITTIPWDQLEDIGRITGKSRDWLLHGSDLGQVEPAVVARLARIEQVLETLVARLDPGD